MNTPTYQADMDAVGHNIRMLLASKGLKQKDLAQMLDVSENAVSKWIRGKGIATENLALIAKALGVNTAALLERQTPLIQISQTVVEATQPDNSEFAVKDKALARIPIVGLAKAGNNGFYDVDNIMDGYIEAISNDCDSFAIQVRGDSMEPAIRSGWYVWCEPSRPLVPGEFCWVALKNGERLLKELLFERPDMIALSSINPDYQRINVMREDIESISYVAGICPPSKKIHY